MAEDRQGRRPASVVRGPGGVQARVSALLGCPSSQSRASRPSSSGRWPIRCGGRASRSAPTWPKGSAGRACRAADFRRFVMMAMGSADEMRVWCRYCLDLGYIDEATWQTLAPGVSRDREDAAGSAARRSGAILMHLSVICRLSSVLWTGSGAFRRPVKAAREGRWRYRKCAC